MDLSIILPTFNEEGHIVDFIEEIKKRIPDNFTYEIIVVDDSKDKTGEVLEEKYKDSSEVKVFLRKKHGLATAILYGVEKARGERILLMDTDFNHDPKYIPEMLELSKNYEIVNGSRYIEGGGMDNAENRCLGSRIFNKFVSLILGLKTTDNTGGYTLFARNLLADINLKEIFRGYGEFCIRLLFALKLKDAKVKEIPVRYAPRRSGESKTYFSKYIFVYTWATLKARLNGRNLFKR